MIKIFVFLSFFFLSNFVLAQQPRIDSIATDEENNELILYGDFKDIISPSVTVDSEELPITTKSVEVLRATIPSSGKGSAGLVQVSSDKLKSNLKLLTYFHFKVSASWYVLYGDATTEDEFVENFIHIRANVQDLPNNRSYSFSPSKLSKYHIRASGNNGIHGGKYLGDHYDSTAILNRSLTYDTKKNSFLFEYWLPNNERPGLLQRTAEIRLNQKFEVIHDHSQDYGTDNDCSQRSTAGCSDINAQAPTDFPPEHSAVRLSLQNSISKAYLTSYLTDPRVQLVLTVEQNETLTIQIIDILGHTVLSIEKNLQPQRNEIPFYFPGLISGIYICRLKIADEVYSLKFLK